MASWWCRPAILASKAGRGLLWPTVNNAAYPMTQQHSDDSSQRLVYFAAERTLSSWVRTALSLMALGFVIDRFDLVLRQLLKQPLRSGLHSHELWTWSGAVLIAMGVLMLVVAGIRYLRFALGYRRDGSTDVGSSLMVAAMFSFVIAIVGVFILFVLITTLR